MIRTPRQAFLAVGFLGMYGAQAGDGRSTISNKEQIRVTTEAIMNMINEF